MTPRVALVASTTTDAPAELLIARLRYLLASGWEPRLLCSGDRWRTHPLLRAPELDPWLELARSRRGNASPFVRRLRRMNPDLIHFHSGWAAWKTLRRSHFQRSRIVISLRDDGQDLAVPDPERLWERAHLLLFGSAAARERAVARGWPARRTEVLHTTVPPPAPAAPTERVISTGPATPLRVLSAGPLIWEQGYEHSVQAIRLLSDRGVRCTYAILGEGDHATAVAFARHQLGVTDAVELLTPDGNDLLTDELRHADVFLDPSVTDTTSSGVLASARAYGLPVITTRDCPEGTAVQVPRRDPGAIAHAIAELAADPDLRKRIGRAGSQVQRALLDGHLAELERLYRRALGAEP